MRRRYAGKVARSLFRCVMGTLRQYVSLAICTCVTFSVVLLTLLHPHGQWTVPDNVAHPPRDGGNGEEKAEHSQARERQPLAAAVRLEMTGGGSGGVDGGIGGGVGGVEQFRVEARRQDNDGDGGGARTLNECQTRGFPLTFSPEELALADVKPPNVSRRARTPTKNNPAVEAKIAALLKSRNSCWRNEKRAGTVACLPYYYLAGFPKCGSTDLYLLLTLHRDILRDRRRRKEMHWLTRARFKFPSGLAGALDNYTGYFGKAMLTLTDSVQRNSSNVIAGDNSASTIWDNRQWRQIPANENCSHPRVIIADVVRHLTPRAKIIVIVRNPTDRLYSEFLFFHDNATKETFHQHAVKAVGEATQCLKRNSIHRCVYVELNDLSPRIHLGLYYVFLADWLQRFPRDQFHVIRLEDMAANRKKVLLRTFAFLGVEPPDEATTKAVVDHPVMRAGTKVKTEGPMLKETRQLLDDFYRPFNARLVSLLNDSRYDWTDQRAAGH